MTRVDEQSRRITGYTLESPPAEERMAGRVDKRTAQTLFRVESAIRDGSWPLQGADDLAHGQYVTARLQQGVAEVVEVLGDLPDVALRIASVVDEFQLRSAFPEEVLQAAKAIDRAIDPLPRTDLRDKPFVTIDGADARDFDDAVLVERRGFGYRLYVAIADVTSHVLPGSLIDREARARGTSSYFPGRVIPMLPSHLSDDLCSLRPNEDRAVLVCEMNISGKGVLQKATFYAGTICSHARLIYQDVAAALESGSTPKGWGRGVAGNVARLAKLHDALAAGRALRGALDFDSRDLQVQLDDTGRVQGLTIPERTVAHRIIEECMILANVAAAKTLRRAGRPFLARVHETPSPEKLDQLRVFLAGRGLILRGGHDPKPADYSDLLGKAEGRPDSGAIQMAVLQSLQQAHYAPSDAGHFGLALEDYAHFTSPIRRYPDLLLHRALYAMLGGPALPAEDWEALGAQCSVLERQSDKAAWAVIEAIKLDFIAERIGESFPGTVNGVTEFGLFVELDGYALSGLVHISQLGADYFVYEPDRKLLRGRHGGTIYTLGQSLNVRIAAVDPATRKLDLVPADIVPTDSRPRRKRRSR